MKPNQRGENLWLRIGIDFFPELLSAFGSVLFYFAFASRMRHVIVWGRFGYYQLDFTLLALIGCALATAFGARLLMTGASIKDFARKHGAHSPFLWRDWYLPGAACLVVGSAGFLYMFDPILRHIR